MDNVLEILKTQVDNFVLEDDTEWLEEAEGYFKSAVAHAEGLYYKLLGESYESELKDQVLDISYGCVNSPDGDTSVALESFCRIMREAGEICLQLHEMQQARKLSVEQEK